MFKDHFSSFAMWSYIHKSDCQAKGYSFWPELEFLQYKDYVGRIYWFCFVMCQRTCDGLIGVRQPGTE